MGDIYVWPLPLECTREFVIAVGILHMPTKAVVGLLKNHATGGEIGSERSASGASHYGSLNETKTENSMYYR
jgi:hypothetical protein